MSLRVSRLAACGLALCAPAVTLLHAQTTPQLAQVLSQMDQAAKTFTNARADVSKDIDTTVGVIHDVEHSTGSIYVERSGSKVIMGAIIMKDGKVSQVINYDGGAARVFSPGVDQIDVYKTGNNQARFDSALTLGFGGSGKDLMSAWDVKDLGPEMLPDGKAKVKTEKLALVSKDAGVRGIYKSVTIWVDPARAVSLKQVSVSPEGITTTATYSNIQLRTKNDMKAFALHTDGNTKTIVH